MWKMDKTAHRRRDVIGEFATSRINPEADQRDLDARFDQELWQACGSAGLLGLCVPEQWGGQALAALPTIYALESLGYHSRDTGLNFAIGAHLLACVVPIWKYGSDEQKERLLPLLCNGSYVAANAITEALSGSDVFNMECQAVKTPSGFQLNGTKTYCSNGPVADIFVTYVSSAPGKGHFGGISAFLLEKEKHVLKVSEAEKKLAVKFCQLGALTLEDTNVGQQALLGKEGRGAQVFNYSMYWERIGLSAVHVGAMDWLLEQAVHFANERLSGGRNLSSHQAVTHPFADLKTKLEGARLLVYQAAAALDAEDRSVFQWASMAKLSVTDAYEKMSLQLMHLFAGEAHRLPHPAEQHLRAALAAKIYSGTSEIHRNLVAKEIGFKATN